MVLELGEQNRVAGAQVRVAPRVRDEVDRFGRVAHPYDLRNVRPDEARELDARVFELRGRAGGDLVYPAMNVCVVLFVVIDQSLDDDARFLRGGRRIEVD